MPEPTTRAALLEEINRLLREARALAVRGAPELLTPGDLVHRVRTLLTIIEELEIAREREGAQARVIERQLADTQRAFWELADQTREQRPPPGDEESWAD